MNIDNLVIEIGASVSKSLDSIKNLIGQFKSLDASSNSVTSAMKKVQDSVSPTTKKLDDLTSTANRTADSFQNRLFQALNITPTMNNDAYKQQIIDTENEINRLKNAIEQLEYIKQTNSLSSSKLAQESIPQIKMDGQQYDYSQIDTYKSRLSELQTYLQQINATQVKPKLSDVVTDADSAKRAINLLTDAMEKARGNTATFQTIADALKRVEKESGMTAKEMNKLGSDGERSGRRIRSSFSGIKLGGFFGGISGLKKALSKFSDAGGQAVDKLTHKFKKLGLGLLGIRTAMSLLTRSVHSYLAFDSELQNSITNTRNMLGALLAPAIELVANLFATAVTYVYTFIKMLTGIDLVARANAKALNAQAGATKSVAEAQKTLSPMDEITNLDMNTNAGGGGGAGGTTPHIDVPEIEPGEMFNKLMEALKNGEWYKAGEIIAEGINNALNSIPWAKIQSGATKFGRGLADFLNGIVDNLDWHLVGTTIGNGLQTAINFAYELFTNFHWVEFGTGLGDALNGVFESVDWAKLGQTVHNGLMGIIDAITAFLKKADFKKIGQSLREFLANLDVTDLLNRLGKMFKEAFKDIADFFEGLLGLKPEGARNLAAAILILGGSIFVIRKVVKIFNKFSKTKDGVKDAASTIGNSFGDMLKSIGKATVIIALLGGLTLVIKSITELLKSFSDTGMSVGDGLLFLGGVMAIIVASFVILSKTIKAIPIQALLSFVVVLGMLSFTILAISDLFKAFQDSSLSLGEAIGLLVVVFGGIVAVMAAVAVLGPAMTAGLLPFIVVMAAINATLFVLAATLPTILKAVGNFIKTVAPSLVAVINSISNAISKIIQALGVALPPIVNAIGNVFSKIFNGIGNVVQKVGNTISKVMSTASRATSTTLNAILSFVNRLGPAVNRLVNGLISAVRTLVNFVVHAMEWLVNVTVVPAANAIIGTINKAPGIHIGKMHKIHIPRLATGTNEIETEGVYHLHEGEAVVPKKYNPATGGYDNGADNKQIIDLLVNLNSNMLALSEREMAVYMDGKKVAEGIYDDVEYIGKNKNVSHVMKRS